MAVGEFVIHPIGVVASPVKHRRHAPLQGDESDVECWIHILPAARRGAGDLRAGQRVIVLTWLHAARRDVLAVRPRGDPRRPLASVFSTRSEHRPNPIGLHEVDIVEVRTDAIRVRGLEAIDGTPVADIKPLLEPKGRR